MNEIIQESVLVCVASTGPCMSTARTTPVTTAIVSTITVAATVGLSSGLVYIRMTDIAATRSIIFLGTV